MATLNSDNRKSVISSQVVHRKKKILGLVLSNLNMQQITL